MVGKNSRGWMIINWALICALICVAIAWSQASDTPVVADSGPEGEQCTLEVNSVGCCPIIVSLPLSSQLEVDGEPDFNDPCMVPGDEGDIYFTVNNTGDVGGDVGFHIVDLVDDDEDIVEPEDMVDGVRDGSDGTPYGDLSRNLDMIISADFGEGYEPFLQGKLYGLNCTRQVFGHLDAEDSVSVRIHWWIDGEVGNIIMTDSSTFDIEFSLEQQIETVLAGGNGTFSVDCGANVTVTADDSGESCQFGSWSDGGAKSHVIHMDGDKAVTAVCVECVPGDRTVVSGKEMSAIGGASTGDGWVLSGFQPSDEFRLGEWVWAWGCGFEHSKWYRIWIQEYWECEQVGEGDELLPELCPPGFPPDGIPIEFETDGDGRFGPIPIWQVPEDPTLICTLWEIVADRMNVEPYDDYNEGFYNEAEDGLDAVACGEWGFHIYPEAFTIILLSVGLAGLGGYVVVRRRRGAETNV
ncbi:MAG: hypothetical protein KAT75_07765 [Dehalococcoidia bacterium]|nr:hypothetical protein [Dehalococcoidia bacterium]